MSDIKQISFAKLDQGMEMPHLLDIQTRAFEALLQLDAASHDREDIGLERVFKDLFPITDVHENFSLEFVRYSLGEPKYSVEECIERDMTYSAPLKATLQLVINEVVNEQKRPRNIIEKEVYLGELPLLTPLGTFVINGAERVIVSQLHRSPGVVFEEATHPNGQRLISARIIPFRGSWVEFTVDIHDVVYVHIDKKKKFPATALLRAFGYGTNSDILRLFFAVRDLDLTKKRESRTDQRELLGAIIAEDIALPGEATAEDAPKARTKKAKAERERAENVLLVKEGDELTEEVFNRLRRQGIDTIKVFSSHMRVDLRDEQDAIERGERDVRRRLALDVVDADGEVIAETGQLLNDTVIKKIRKAEINKVSVFVTSGRAESTLIKNTLAKDPTHSEKEALSQIYALLRPGDAPDAQTAKQALERLFFSPKRYDLGRVGRYKINQRLGMTMPADYTVLSKEDFVEIIRYLVELHEGRGHVDDIDHLGNRRIRSVGELIANQFSVGLSRMARLVKERMSINTDPEKISLDDLVNARTVSAVIQAFFGSSQLSQFMDQTNPLGRADAQASSVGARTGRSDARARRLRSARRALLAVRPHVPDRDAGRSEHRTHHVARLLRAGERPRVRRDAVSRREERQGARTRSRGSTRIAKKTRSSRRPTRASTTTETSSKTSCSAVSRATCRSRRRIASSTWTWRRSSSSRSPPRSFRSSSTTTRTAR